VSRYNDAFKVEGVIVEALPKSRFRVELPNGHRLLAHMPRRLQDAAAGLAVGQRVALEISPCDLSKGNIVDLERVKDESSRVS
jgi:translation initiation factor IF-1